MSLILKNELSRYFPKIGSHEWQEEEFEIAPGLVCTIKVEDNGLLEAVEKFIHRKGSVGELRKILKTKVRGGGK